jgi:hypothetical protein
LVRATEFVGRPIIMTHPIFNAVGTSVFEMVSGSGSERGAIILRQGFPIEIAVAEMIAG